MIAFETYLYGDFGYERPENPNDTVFLVDKFIHLPSIRPFFLEKIVEFCIEFCHNSDFRNKLLEKSNKCPILLYKLFQKGVLSFAEIETHLRNNDSFIVCYYFRKEINDFMGFILEKYKPKELDEGFLENDNDIDDFIEFGFLPSSIEYCLKYDDIDFLRNIDLLFVKDAQWSPFEWSLRPDSLKLLPFSGYFGSINCFKHLLLNGFEICEVTRSSIVCSGSFDLFHLCNYEKCFFNEIIFNATKFSQQNMLAFFTENGADINTRNKNQ